jgi:hypothetical protein
VLAENVVEHANAHLIDISSYETSDALIWDICKWNSNQLVYVSFYPAPSRAEKPLRLTFSRLKFKHQIYLDVYLNKIPLLLIYKTKKAQSGVLK